MFVWKFLLDRWIGECTGRGSEGTGGERAKVDSIPYCKGWSEWEGMELWIEQEVNLREEMEVGLDAKCLNLWLNSRKMVAHEARACCAMIVEYITFLVLKVLFVDYELEPFGFMVNFIDWCCEIQIWWLWCRIFFFCFTYINNQELFETENDFFIIKNALFQKD